MSEANHRLRLALELLGDTADQVAGTLKFLGVQGRRSVATSCPIARFLCNNGFRNAWVDEGETNALWHNRRGIVLTKITTPIPAFYFLSKFDDGLYPELEL